MTKRIDIPKEVTPAKAHTEGICGDISQYRMWKDKMLEVDPDFERSVALPQA